MANEGTNSASAFGMIPRNVSSVDAGGNVRVVTDFVTFDETYTALSFVPFGGTALPNEARVISVLTRGEAGMPGSFGSVTTDQPGVGKWSVCPLSGLNTTTHTRVEYDTGFDLSNKKGGRLYMSLDDSDTFSTPATVFIQILYAIE